MAYTKITSAHNGDDALAYLEGSGHNGNEERNMYFTGINMRSPEFATYAKQMLWFWNKSSDRMKVQIRRMVQSFSEKELDPNNESDILKAHEIGIETGKRVYGNRQFIVATQIDGKSGLVHNHIFGNNVDMLTLKGMSGDEYQHSRISKISDEVIKEFGVTLDYGEKNNSKYTQSERAKRDSGQYVWKDDLRQRIRESLNDSTDYDTFNQALAFRGVSLRKGKTLTYTLDDTTEYEECYGELPKRILKARPKSLGDAFDKDSIENSFLENQKQLTDALQQQQQSAKQQEEVTTYDDNNDGDMTFEFNDIEDFTRIENKMPDNITTKQYKEKQELEERRQRRLRNLDANGMNDIEKAYNQLHQHQWDNEYGD